MSLESQTSDVSNLEPGDQAKEVDIKMPSMRITKLELKKEYPFKEESNRAANEYINSFIEKTQSSKYSFKEKKVSQSVGETLKGLQGEFSMRIYCIYRTVQSKLRKIVDKFTLDDDDAADTVEDDAADDASDESADAATQTDQSFEVLQEDILLFLTTNIPQSTSDTTPYRPEIYALTSGFAYCILNKNVCDGEFPIKCAKRVLKFDLKALSTKHLIGNISSKTESYKPVECTMVTFWDYLGQITTSYKMTLRDDASLYQLLWTKKGIPKMLSMTVGETYLRMSPEMSLKDIALLLYQLSRIARGEESKKYQSEEQELDDNAFDVFYHVKIVKDKKKLEPFNDILMENIISHLKGQSGNFGLYLSYWDPKAWENANEFKLKDGRQILQTWEGDPPYLVDLLQEVVKYKDEQEEANYRDIIKKLSLQMSGSNEGDNRTNPLLKYIHCQITENDESLFCYGGKWLKIENEYMVNLENQFSQIELHNRLSENILSLPWTCVSDEEKMPTRQQTFEGGLFLRWMKQILDKDSNLDDFNMKAGQNTFEDVKMDDYMEKPSISFEERARQLFYRMLCQQAEEHYNEGYILYDQLVSDNTSGYLLGDRIFVFGQNNIELYDILHYTQEKTYLIHVKEGFGNSTRDACSQIRISAEFVFRHLVCNNSFDILASYWSRLTMGGGKYRQVVRDRYLKLGEDGFYQLFKRNEIIFVLAYRDAKITTNNDSFVPYPKERLSRRFKDDFNLVTEELLARNYLKEIHGQLAVTDKVFTTVEQAREEIQLKSKKDARAAFSILKETMSSHSSFIAKMEVVHLFSHFRTFVTAGKRLSLKMCRLQTSFE
ncbi:uncharacterized protein [Haliotis cracherodii]|uniref:uncharacterized protein n=1 Tax=Haliotis cracherodii TaxID=6455 RepID=UPI0039E97EC7